MYGKVQMVDQLGHLVVHIDQALCKFVGVAGGVPDAFNAGHVGHVFNQQGKVGNLCGVTHFAAVGIDVLAQQGDFSNTLFGQACHFHQHVFKRTTHFFAAGVRHHAITAIFAAAFHDGDEGGGAVHFGGR